MSILPLFQEFDLDELVAAATCLPDSVARYESKTMVTWFWLACSDELRSCDRGAAVVAARVLEDHLFRIERRWESAAVSRDCVRVHRSTVDVVEVSGEGALRFLFSGSFDV